MQDSIYERSEQTNSQRQEVASVCQRLGAMNANMHRVSFGGDEMVLNYIVVNILNATELYTLNR